MSSGWNIVPDSDHYLYRDAEREDRDEEEDEGDE